MKNCVKNSAKAKECLLIKHSKKAKKLEIHGRIEIEEKKSKNITETSDEENKLRDELVENNSEYKSEGSASSNMSEEELSGGDEDDDLTVEKHKQALKKLGKIDPEFHKYLEDNDKNLLKFESSESENETESKWGTHHKPSHSLEVASDDSEYEDEETEIKGKITIQMVNIWECELNTNNKNLKPVTSVVRAFHACLIRVSGNTTTERDNLRVDGGAVFNAVVRLCITSLYSYLKRVLSLPATSISKKHVEVSRKWPQAKSIVRSYIIDLMKLLGSVTSEDVLRVLLKHLHQMIPFAACLPTISKIFLKHVILLWSCSNDDTVRVISFLCILRYAASDLNLYLEAVLKKMYVSFVKNCKFISQNSIPMINFMKKSLCEMYSLNENITYNHAFLYVRQLAIHLRSAVTLKKKDSIQTVYNWQFMSSLQLWVDVLCCMHEKQQIRALIYPTVQVIIGCIKLIPTAQYFPLRFHCIRMLIKISKETSIFVPVLPLLIDALATLNVNTQHKKLSMRPMDFTYILRLSKSQLQEIAFKDGVIENVYDCLLEYAACESYRISFPDTVVLLLVQMKQFIKDCRYMNFTKKLKPLMEKIEEVSKFIDKERNKSNIALYNASAITAWESNMKLKSNSLITFYESWCKIRKEKILRKFTEDIKLTEYELPVLKKLPGSKKDKTKMTKKDGRVVLFDSENESEIEIKFDETKETKREDKNTMKTSSLKQTKYKRKSNGAHIPNKSKKIKLADEIDESQDIVTDFNLTDFLL